VTIGPTDSRQLSDALQEMRICELGGSTGTDRPMQVPDQ
jgi:hypothetical protein